MAVELGDLIGAGQEHAAYGPGQATAEVFQHLEDSLYLAAAEAPLSRERPRSCVRPSPIQRHKRSHSHHSNAHADFSRTSFTRAMSSSSSIGNSLPGRLPSSR